MRRKRAGLIAPLVVGALLLVVPPSAFASIRFVTQWGSEGTGDGQFQRPYGVATDSSDNVYVIEYDGARVDKFTSSGNFITKWGSSGSGAGQFTHARDIAVGASDNVYIADTGNNRVEEFSSSGSFIRQWGGSGTGDGEFDKPTGIATDSAGSVYVADAGDGRVQKFDATGNFLATWFLGDSSDPTDVAIDSSGDIYVNGSYVDSHGGYAVIRKYDSSGNFLTEWGDDWAVSLAIDPSDRLFVAGEFARMEEFGSSGTFITSWGRYGTGAGQFDRPSGVATNSAGDIYVADTYNNRIQVFRQSTALPDTTISGGPNGTIGDSTPTFRFSSPDLDAGFSCKLDSGPYKPCHSPWTARPLADGAHTFHVAAIDRNGADPTPAVRSFALKATNSTAVGLSGSTLVVTAALDVRNNIRIGRHGSTIRVTDGAYGGYYYTYPGGYTGSSIKVGLPCTRTGVSSAECPAAMITRIRVMARDEPDLVRNSPGMPSTLAGGGGVDILSGGFGPDTLIGGADRDSLVGNAGNDLILARDGANDGIDCDGNGPQFPEGHADKAELDKLPLDRNSNITNCETKIRR